MSVHLAIGCFFVTIIFTISNAIPASLMAETKAINLRTNKVKRAPESGLFHSPEARIGENNPNTPIAYYGNPSAKKRGVELKNDNSESHFGSDGDHETHRQVNLFNQQSSRHSEPDPYSTGDDPMDEKTVTEYEKGFRYGTNKDKLDEQMENAVLKSELYGDPSAINRYRYYGRDDRRTKRSHSTVKNKARLSNRFKRELALSPEDFLALVSLWEGQHQRNQNEYNHVPSRYYGGESEDVDLENEGADDIEDADENWLDTPVVLYPNSGRFAHNPLYYDVKDYPLPQHSFSKRGGRWIDFGERNKRFMVSRKRSSSPSHELRYFGDRNRDDDVYTLSQLLGSSSQQKDPNVPLYRRVML